MLFISQSQVFIFLALSMILTIATSKVSAHDNLIESIRNQCLSTYHACASEYLKAQIRKTNENLTELISSVEKGPIMADPTGLKYDIAVKRLKRILAEAIDLKKYDRAFTTYYISAK